MGIFRRVSDLVKANLNDIIDKADDPVKALRHVIRRLDDRILTLRGRLRACSIRIEGMKSRMDEKKEEAARWQKRAEAAVDDGDDDRARSALLHKRNQEAEAKELEQRWWKATREKEEQEKEVMELENRAQEARRCKDAILAKKETDPTRSAFHRVVPPPFDEKEKNFENREIEKELKRLIQRRRNEKAGK
jgi:phage shock protein A